LHDHARNCYDRHVVIALAAVASMVPVRVHHPPRIDGRLDDWAEVPGDDELVQQFPHDGDQPTNRTVIKVAYDTDNVYFAIDCRQSQPIVARLTRRDRETDDDRVTIDLDTAHDRRSAFHFQVSAAGVLVDGLRFNDTDFSTDWDETWRAEVARTSTGWTAEIAIPLRILRLHDRVTTWGFQVRRYIAATGELDMWAYAPRDAGGEVSRYGDLGPFDALSPRTNLTIVPFALGRLTRADDAIPSPYGHGASASAGVDVTWQPAPQITLSGALLPDFGQVEADQIVINLANIEIEYPEKRPFFLQGIDLFQTPIQLVYTRRIGRAATPPVVPDGVNQLDAAAPAQVLAAAKLVATAGPVDFGAIAAQTGDVTVATDAGRVQAEPSASDYVMRARGSGGGFTVGALATAQKQGEDIAAHPTIGDEALCPNGSRVPIGSRCSHDATTGGVDAAYRSPEGVWAGSGQLVGSEAFGGPSRLLLDGTRLSSGDTGIGGTARVAKEGGTLRGEVDYEGYSRKLDIDDLGYLERANLHHLSVDLEAYASEFGPFIDAKSRVELFWRWNLDGYAGPSGYQWNVSATGKDLWEAFLELHWRPSYIDDRELGDGRGLERSGRLGLELSFNTNPRRAVVLAWNHTMRATHDGYEIYGDGSLKLRPREDFELELQPNLIVTRGEPRFLHDRDADGPRFARQDVTSFGTTTRATWTLERNLTIQGYLQILYASLRYRDAFTASSRLVVIGLDELRPAAFDPRVYDLGEGVIDASVVARWEYRPGSTAYLVYSHAQVPAGDRVGGAALVHGPASDAVLAKLSWAYFL
jgi:hypothetical protein